MNEELNKKLAEWAGFRQVTKKEVYDIGHYTLWENDLGYGESRLPDFTESLDACFKWLVPKLHRVNIIQEFNSEAYAEVTIQPEYEYMHYKSWAETPALALCKAIEQLTDKERK